MSTKDKKKVEKRDNQESHKEIKKKRIYEKGSKNKENKWNKKIILRKYWKRERD